MILTILSKITNNTIPSEVIINPIPIRLPNISLTRVINKWPAIMLALIRIPSIKGRIKLLSDSIKTIKGVKAYEIFSGTRCDKNLLVLKIILTKNKLIHKIILKVNVTLKCLVVEKM